jgi:hypothetical protein
MAISERAVFVQFLDTPIPGVLAIPEQLGAEIVGGRAVTHFCLSARPLAIRAVKAMPPYNGQRCGR